MIRAYLGDALVTDARLNCRPRDDPARASCGATPSSGAAASRCARRTSASGRPTPGPTYAAEVEAAAYGLALARPRRGRPHGHHRRQPPAALLGVPRRAGARARSPCRSTRTPSPTSWGSPSSTPACGWSSPRTRSRSTRCWRCSSRPPAVEHVLFEDPKGMTGYDEHHPAQPRRPSPSTGRAAQPTDPDLVRRSAWPRVGPDDVALISYTSGSTGDAEGRDAHPRQPPRQRGRARSHQERWQQGDEGMAYLPMAWIGDTAYSLAMSLLAGAVVSCPEDPATVQRDLREIGPMVLIGPPRIWENLLTDIRMRMDDADRFKRSCYRRFIARGRRGRGGADGRDGACRPAPAGAHRLGRPPRVRAAARPDRASRRIRYAYSGGAALGPETLRFYRGIGVNLKQIYGITEAGGLVCVQPDGEMQVRLGRPAARRRRGQLRRRRRDPAARARRSSSGYYRNPEATARGAERRLAGTRATPGSSTPTGTSWSSTGPRTSPGSTTARRSRRSSSRTSSSSART